MELLTEAVDKSVDWVSIAVGITLNYWVLLRLYKTYTVTLIFINQ